MNEKTKKLINKISAGVLVVGTAGFLLTGGTEGGAGSIIALAAAGISAVILIVKAIID